MTIARWLGICVVLACGVACRNAGQPDLTVAAAANLTGVFGQIGQAFTQQTGIHVVFSYASTAQLAQQIENAALFDGFAPAVTVRARGLVRRRRTLPARRACHPRGWL